MLPSTINKRSIVRFFTDSTLVTNFSLCQNKNVHVPDSHVLSRQLAHEGVSVVGVSGRGRGGPGTDI